MTIHADDFTFRFATKDFVMLHKEVAIDANTVVSIAAIRTSFTKKEPIRYEIMLKYAKYTKKIAVYEKILGLTARYETMPNLTITEVNSFISQLIEAKEK